MSHNLGIDLFVPKEGSYMYAVSFGMGQKRGLGPRHKLRGFTSYFSLSLSGSTYSPIDAENLYNW